MTSSFSQFRFVAVLALLAIPAQSHEDVTKTLSIASIENASLGIPFPEEPTHELGEHFPRISDNISEDRLWQLGLYKVRLEVFRGTDLEAYNKRVIEFTEELDAFSEFLERAKKNHSVSTIQYNYHHFQLTQSFRKASKTGILMFPYFTYLEKYRKWAKWVTEQIEKENIRIKKEDKRRRRR